MRFSSISKPPLYEAVLYTPAEVVLQRFIDAAPSDETKRWFATNFKNWVTKQPANLYQLPYLPRNATEQQQKAFGFNDLYDLRLAPATETTIEHILDYFKANPNLPRLERMSVPNVIAAADEVVRRYNAQQAKKAGQLEDKPTDINVLIEYPGGYRMVELLTKEALNREGTLMGHCIGSMHCRPIIIDKTHRGFSLRDPNNEPHATIEVTADGMRTTEIKGRQNAAPVRRYWPMLLQFVQQYGVQVDRDHRNIGLLKIDDPETGRAETLTQDQFRDMIQDPGNVRGQALITQYQAGRGAGSDDQMLGMFTALYGTDQLDNRTINSVFRRMPDHAIQVVQHYGNKLTDEQLALALEAVGSRRGEDNVKALVMAAKPDIETTQFLLNYLDENAGGDTVDHFVMAVAQSQPVIYREVITATPDALERELDAKGERAAAPFFALAGTETMTPEIVYPGFRYQPQAAMKRFKAAKIVPEQDLVAAALDGAGHTYWSRDSNLPQYLDSFLAYMKPDADTLRTTFANLSHGSAKEFAGSLLIAARKQTPDLLDKQTVETAVMAIDKPDLYKDLLASDSDPSEELQRKLFAKDKPEMMQDIQHVDPVLFDLTYQGLRPRAIPKTKEDYRHVYPKKADGSRDYQKPGKQIKYQRQLTPEERTKAIDEERKKAIRRFTDKLSPLVREPGTDAGAPLDRQSEKFLAAKAAFDKMGKGKLFDTAINRIDHKALYASMFESKEAFEANLNNPSISGKEIATVIDRSQYSRLGITFANVVNLAPQRVPEIIAVVPERGYRKDNLVYGDMKFPSLDKAKTFEALEAVWASKIPEGIKDDFTLKVFKRFKPTPANLLSMLDKADNEEAVRFVLKKTKRPSKELVAYVADGFPDLMTYIPLESIPDPILADVFKNDPTVATALMDRDLRGYAAKNPRSKYAGFSFTSKIDRNSPAFARYQKAAEAAGLGPLFARYARQAELEDTHDQKLMGRRDDTLSWDLLAQHMDEYSDRTLLKVAHRNEAQVIPFYFEHFDAEKLAGLIRQGLFERRYHHYGYGERQADDVIPKLDARKLRDAMITALGEGSTPGISAVLHRMRDAKFKFDDDLILAYLATKAGDTDMRDTLLRGKVGDKVKDWVADNLPLEMDEIRQPNQHMIDVLFDQYAKLTRDRQGKVSVEYFFEVPVKAWFRDPSQSRYGSFVYKANPKVLTMLRDTAVQHGGVAVTALAATLRQINQLRQGKQDTYSHPEVHVPPRGVPFGKD